MNIIEQSVSSDEFYFGSWPTTINLQNVLMFWPTLRWRKKLVHTLRFWSCVSGNAVRPGHFSSCHRSWWSGPPVDAEYDEQCIGYGPTVKLHRRRRARSVGNVSGRQEADACPGRDRRALCPGRKSPETTVIRRQSRFLKGAKQFFPIDKNKNKIQISAPNSNSNKPTSRTNPDNLQQLVLPTIIIVFI